MDSHQRHAFNFKYISTETGERGKLTAPLFSTSFLHTVQKMNFLLLALSLKVTGMPQKTILVRATTLEPHDLPTSVPTRQCWNSPSLSFLL